MPVYIILFLLLIRRLDVIPYEIVYTPAAAAAPRHSMFSPPPPPATLTDEQKATQLEMSTRMRYNIDNVRFGVSPRGGVAAQRVASGLCQWIKGLGLQVTHTTLTHAHTNTHTHTHTPCVCVCTDQIRQRRSMLRRCHVCLRP